MEHDTLHPIRGIARFGAGVLIGNWFEEGQQREALLTDLTEKKASGALPGDKYETPITAQCTPLRFQKTADAVCLVSPFGTETI